MKFFSAKEEPTKEQLVEQIILDNYNRYYRLAYSYVHNPDDAGDIVQNGAYQAIKSSGTLKHKEYAATWVYRIMLNEIFRFLKLPDTVSWEELPAEHGTNDVYEDLDLTNALNSLPVEDKAVIELRYFEGLKLEEIAEVLGENVSTVKSRLYRGIQKLKIKMEVS